MIETILWLTLTIYHESRGEEFFDQLAIAHSVINRSNQSGKSIKEEVLKPKQFSCYNNGVALPTDIKALFVSARVALTALSGTDVTGGATHYHTTKVKPKWRHKVTFVNRFGNHLFYKKLITIKAERKVIKYGKAIARRSSRSPVNSYGS